MPKKNKRLEQSKKATGGRSLSKYLRFCVSVLTSQCLDFKTTKPRLKASKVYN